MTTYACQSCGAAVAVVAGAVVRSCACDAPVVASLRATARGVGGTAG